MQKKTKNQLWNTTEALCSGWCAGFSPSSSGAWAKLEPSRTAKTPGMYYDDQTSQSLGVFQEDGGQDKPSMGSSSELVSSSESPLSAEYLMETSPQPESLVRLMSQFGMRAKEAQVWLDDRISARVCPKVLTFYRIIKDPIVQYTCALCGVTVFQKFMFFFFEKGNRPKVLDFPMHSDGKGCCWCD